MLRAKSDSNRTAQVHVGVPISGAGLPQLDPEKSVHLDVAPGEAREVYAALPADIKAAGGRLLQLVVLAEHNVAVEGLAVVPLADEIAPPAPKPWNPDAGTD